MGGEPASSICCSVSGSSAMALPLGATWNSWTMPPSAFSCAKSEAATSSSILCCKTTSPHVIRNNPMTPADEQEFIALWQQGLTRLPSPSAWASRWAR